MSQPWTQHTPGPWTVDEKTLESSKVKVVGPEGFLGVAQAFGDNVDETLANGMLIAAAPALLEALRSINNALELCGPGASKAQILNQANYALGRARAALRQVAEATD